MTVSVLFFATLREHIGKRELQLELPSSLSLRQLAERLEADYKGLSLSGSLCAINEQYSDPDATIQAGDTVAFFPPVSGG